MRSIHPDPFAKLRVIPSLPRDERLKGAEA